MEKRRQRILPSSSPSEAWFLILPCTFEIFNISRLDSSGPHDSYLAYSVAVASRLGRHPGIIQWQYASSFCFRALFRSIWRAIASGLFEYTSTAILPYKRIMQPDLVVHLAWLVLRLQPGGICYWPLVFNLPSVPTEESSMRDPCSCAASLESIRLHIT